MDKLENTGRSLNQLNNIRSNLDQPETFHDQVEVAMEKRYGDDKQQQQKKT